MGVVLVSSAFQSAVVCLFVQVSAIAIKKFAFFFKSPCFLLLCLTGSIKWRKTKPQKTPCIIHRIALANCPDLTVPLEVTQGEKEGERVWMCSCLRPLGTAEQQTSTLSSPMPDALSCLFYLFIFLSCQLCYSLCISTAQEHAYHVMAGNKLRKRSVLQQRQK